MQFHKKENSMKNAKVRTQLLMAFGTMAGLIFFMSLFGVLALGHARDRFAGYVEGIDARNQLAAQLRSAINDRAIAARNTVLAISPADIQAEKARGEQAHARVQKALAALKERIA
ncbi:hypothetical protein, partial [Microbacterium sp. 18062]|uniref:hypothetical protein n=1 Tax=Microbacterium sp. 18062 TaxID=2681410 RepID=UPI00190F18CD